MKKIITMAVLIFSSMLTYACTGGAEQKQAETQKTAQDGSVIVMNKAMFIKDIFDYEKSKEWKYKGDKPAIIDLYADWCGPCRMENPNMVKLYDDFKDKGLAVISVSLDERKAAWTQAIQKDGMPWVHVSDLKGWKSEVVKLYNVDSVPCILVLDENNRILAMNIRAEKLRAFVEERLGK